MAAVALTGGLAWRQFRPFTPEELTAQLSQAVSAGDVSAAHQALQRGANPNRIASGEQPLLISAIGNKRLSELLLQHGADPNATDHRGVSALMKAIWVRDIVTARKLLAAGANAKAYSTAFHTSPLQLAVGQNAPRELILDLIKGGADVNVANAGGVTLLMNAVQKRDKALVKELLSQGAEVDRKGFVLMPSTGQQVLMSAVQLARKEKLRDIERMLLEARKSQ